MNDISVTDAGLKIRNLSVEYNKIVAVDSINLEINNGETVVLFGPSGCGKTSILKAVLGVSEPGIEFYGSVVLNGIPITKGNGDVGMVFQGPVIPGWLKVVELCRMGCRMRKMTHMEQKDRINSMLKRFDIIHLSNKYPSQMSGGERQRAALAVTLLNEPKVLMLDEPTTFIDGMTRIAIWDFVEKEIRPLGIPIIIVSHDPTEALTLGDNIYILSNPAKIIDQLTVPFDHPRTDVISKDERFWDLREKLMNRK